MTTIRVSITDDLMEFLREQVEKGGYRDVSEYLQSVLREVQERAPRTVSPARASDSNGRRAWDVALAIGASVPDSEWNKVPSDLSKNLDHYLYGTPRED